MRNFEPVPTDVYRKIREGIVDLRYRPGQKLSEEKLAAELGVGRSPVRSALARLERDGWVRVMPQHGTFVRQFSPDEVRAMSELRLLLESHNASVTAARIGADELKLLKSRFKALAAKGAEQHRDEYLALDDLFHELLARVAANPLISEILRNLRDQIRWVRTYNAVLPGRTDASLREMYRVLTALERRDGEAAAKAMREHIGNIATSYETVATGTRTPAVGHAGEKPAARSKTAARKG
jgi:DNA-binding GntR family transcriptional regulator